MGFLRNYIIAIVAVSLIAVLAASFIRSESMRKVTKFVAGLLILLVAVRPLLELGDLRVEQFLAGGLTEDLDLEDAQTRYREALARHVRQTSEEFIERKADALGAAIQARVQLSDGDPPTPCYVVIVGTLDPEQVRALSDYMTEAFAIPKENQEWKLYE